MEVTRCARGGRDFLDLDLEWEWEVVDGQGWMEEALGAVVVLVEGRLRFLRAGVVDSASLPEEDEDDEESASSSEEEEEGLDEEEEDEEFRRLRLEEVPCPFSPSSTRGIRENCRVSCVRAVRLL